MKSALFVFALLFSVQGFAAYGSGWYMADFWSGEYPNGFAVVNDNVRVPARTGMDLDLPKNVMCPLTKKAVWHPWNQARPATYKTASKIVTLRAKESFTYKDEESGKRLRIKRGDRIEYLIYGSEGFFWFRYKGKKYMGSQDLLAKMRSYNENDFRQDEWVNLPCADGQRAWIYLKDLVQTNSEGESTYFPGIGDWWPGFVEYGQVRDLP